MAKGRFIRRTLTFQGRQSAGPCECPCCRGPAKVLKYANGEKWSTLLCKVCGWYQVPTMNAHPQTEFQVKVLRWEESRRNAAQ